MSQVISYRLSTDEVLALRQRAMSGESNSQTAQRLMKNLLGVTSTNDTQHLDERITNSVNSIVDGRIQALKTEVLAVQQEQINLLRERVQALEPEAQLLRKLLNESIELTQSYQAKNDIDDIADEGVDPVILQASEASPLPEEKYSELPSELNLSQLARRLGVVKSVISRRKSRSDFEQWAKGKDPDGIAWEYDGKNQKFFPIGG